MMVLCVCVSHTHTKYLPDTFWTRTKVLNCNHQQKNFTAHMTPRTPFQPFYCHFTTYHPALLPSAYSGCHFSRISGQTSWYHYWNLPRDLTCPRNPPTSRSILSLVVFVSVLLVVVLFLVVVVVLLLLFPLVVFVSVLIVVVLIGEVVSLVWDMFLTPFHLSYFQSPKCLDQLGCPR